MPVEPRVKPLTKREEQAWRALIRLMVELPRAIDDDILRRAGMSLTRYVVLMRLSESPEHALRMSDLAEAVSLSPSRLTRVVQAMVKEGLVAQSEDTGDRRVSRARLTDAGLSRLQEVWPEHLASVRALVLDHIDAGDLTQLHRIIEGLRRGLDSSTDVSPAQHRR